MNSPDFVFDYIDKYPLLQKLTSRPYIADIIQSKACIAGGYIRAAMFDTENIDQSDIDIFLLSDAYEYIKATIIDNYKLYRQLRGPNGLQLEVTNSPRNKPIRYNIIHKKVYDNPLDVVKDFDFTVCKAYIADNTLCYDKDFVKHNVNRELHIGANTKASVAQVYRFFKYIRKGYTVVNNERLNAFWQELTDNRYGIPYDSYGDTELDNNFKNKNIERLAWLKSKIKKINTDSWREIISKILLSQSGIRAEQIVQNQDA